MAMNRGRKQRNDGQQCPTWAAAQVDSVVGRVREMREGSGEVGDWVRRMIEDGGSSRKGRKVAVG